MLDTVFIWVCVVWKGVLVEIADELSNAMSQYSIPVAAPTQPAAGITPSSNVSVELPCTPISTHSP